MTCDCVTCDFLHGSCFSGRMVMCRRKICYALAGFYLLYLVMILLMRSGDVETNPGPNTLESTISEIEFQKLAQDIHPSDYMAVGISLGLSHTQLDQILIEKLKNYTNALLDVFMKWDAKQQPPNTNKREVLADALLENDLGDLSQRLRYGRLMKKYEGTITTDEGESAARYEYIIDTPPDLILPEDEEVISCGIRFSPSGAKLTTPFKVTLDHNALFTNPRQADIVFYTRSTDTEQFVRIPNRPGDYPHCDVRMRDLDLFVDHFSVWWIVAIKRHFAAKRVVCTPYLQHPLPTGFTNILLYIHNDYHKVHKIVERETEGYRTALPPKPLSVSWNSGNFRITLYECQDSHDKQEKKIGEEMITTRDIYRKNRNYVHFIVETPVAETRQKVLRFILDQGRSQSGRIVIPFIISYDDQTKPPAESETKPLSSEFIEHSPDDETQSPQNESDSDLESRVFSELSVPPEILARGPKAIRAYALALEIGKKKVFRTRLMLVGQEGVGKTSLKKSLTGQRFDPKEKLTDGAETEDICEINIEHTDDAETEDVCGISIEHIELHKDDNTSWSVKQKGNADDSVGEFKRVVVDHMVSTLRDNTSKEQASSEASLEPDSNESDDRHQVEAGAHGEKIPDGITKDKATTSQFDIKETTDTRMYGDKTVEAESTAVSPLKDERSKIEATEAPKVSEVPEVPRETRKDEGLPDDVAGLVEERLKVEGAESGNDEGKNKASLNIWDFAGHDVYYTTHQVFLTWRAIYVIVFDLSTDLDSVVPPECRNRYYQRAKQGTKSELTCLEFIEFWLFSIYAHAVRPSPEYSDSTKKTDQKSPPIFIVGTHRDEVGKESEGDRQEKRKEKITAAFDRIRTIVKGKPFECHVIPQYYQIENSLEGDKELGDLRKHIEQVAKNEPYMGEEIPLKWLKFEEFHATNTKNNMTLNQIKEQTQQIGIESEKELQTMLNFYHDLGSIVYYGDVKETESPLRDMVVLNPQWLINVFKQVITILEPEKRAGIDSKAWSTLEDDGILEDQLIQHMWQEFQEQKDALVELMMKFDLICKAPANMCQDEEADCEIPDKTAKSPQKRYYVPSRLPPRCQQRDSPKSSIEFYIDFHGFLPEGLFHRLMARVVEWKRNRNEVRLFYRQISMTVDDEHEALLTMLPPSDAAIKVIVFRPEMVSDEEAESVPETSDPQTPDPKAVKEVFY